MRPRIGITTYGPEGARSSFSLPRCYSDAVAAAGGMPVLLVSGSIPDDELLDSIDALIVAGGGDIDPESYGGAGHETVYSVNPARDSFEMSLLRRALERTELPVLGICRGMQIMNIVLGGDLEPHLPDVYGESVLHRLPPREPTSHGVRAERSGIFGEIFTDAEFPVCSWHHQALRKLGSGLEVTAHAPDGVVEGVVFDSHPFALGVQWHPEMQALDDARQLRLFAALVGRARAPLAVSEAQGTVLTVTRGGCDVVYAEQVIQLKLVGKHAHRETALAVGDLVSFDPLRKIVIDVLPRRTVLARQRSFGKQREQVLAANADRLAIVASVASPPFRSGAVDRFLLAAHLGGLEAILVVNKLDLLEPGAALPDEIRAYESVVEVFAVSARVGAGLDAFRAKLAKSTTVLAGHSGVGKSSLLNALQPELRLQTGEISKRDRGSHTTSASSFLRLANDAVVIDTPGVREIASGPIDPSALGPVYPEIELLSADCRFRDCRHRSEPRCAVRAAVESGALPAARLANYHRLLDEAAAHQND